jgi:SAM-dependent methyltransferase
VEYHTEGAPEGGVAYNIETVIQSVGQAYDTWIGSRPQPFFGAHANAKVMSLAHSLGIPESVAVLDIGAGDGRNTLPLAQAGFPTDSVEVSEGFAQLLRTKLLEAKLPGEVFQGDLLDSNLGLPIAHYKLVVLAGVLVAHVRGTHHLRAILEVVSKVLRPGGQVLFSIFRTRDGFEPDILTRQLGEVFWTVMFTPAELSEAVEGLGLTLVDDVSYADYEREALPESWPPTDYFQAYVDGLDLFDLPARRTPIDLRWLTYRKV